MQYMGDAAALAAWLPDVVRECRERGDRYAETTLRASVMPFVRLCADDPEGARRECAQARATWTTAEFHVQHYFAAMADLAAAVGRLPRLTGWSGSPSIWMISAFAFLALSPRLYMISPQATEQ